MKILFWSSDDCGVRLYYVKDFILIDHNGNESGYWFIDPETIADDFGNLFHLDQPSEEYGLLTFSEEKAYQFA